uniref:N-acetyltransferase domain-containing protein n=1 Tax=Chlamydomonas leiostraca TaxID=1034604 RepID=A0A7S0RSD7_9CHLO|mmetsp:Transcript_2909/g.7189  ORF Transcript_2909/g.7189 Transcript_2909/m.7189 type:complete len:208 (+) Transcript_2909:62-685(+)|eukprot:CAMPEP_0202861142 /NCGR_PEP_ID=MMETSP1391-20130828/2638_1 /ASSEMBLY_ACC=CAM_ASM_000867 /TAXON_ID=1034604 /ORGANISM="Chlamydomonas leiostraca, Strain SAG 11-49" /LENGTH=207 /DNA_ID=CAMNT_0049540473 /DNA_START=40 /DNA_END=663 /DNA_ORIENTATION=-
MKINADVCIQGVVCQLVPYKRHHVDKYHQWMQDPEIQRMTESEPLSLEEEYEMMESWREDEEKCTFIILDRPSSSSPSPPSELPDPASEVAAMAGDVNIYVNDPEDRGTVEIEVMVAELGCRRKGIAREAVTLMMAFAVQRLGVTRARAKILDDNEPSIKLFLQMGFQETKRVAVFHEVHMELDCSPGSQHNASLSQMSLATANYSK